MSVTVKGLDALQHRLAYAAAVAPVKQALHAEAEGIAAEARARAPGALGENIEIIDQSRGDIPAFAVGTRDPAGRFIEYGTVRRAATPWLGPVFWARSLRVKHKLARLIAANLKPRSGAV